MDIHQTLPAAAVIRRRGVTLVELAMAMSVFAMVALVASIVLNSGLQSNRDQSDSRRRDLSAEAAGERIDSVLRSGARVLACSTSAVVLWRSDVNGNGTVEVSELVRLELDSGQIKSYRAAGGLDPADDTTYPLTTDFMAASGALRGNKLTASILCSNASTFSLAVHATGPSPGGLVSYRLTQRDPAGEWTTASCVTLRNW